MVFSIWKHWSIRNEFLGSFESFSNPIYLMEWIATMHTHALPSSRFFTINPSIFTPSLRTEQMPRILSVLDKMIKPELILTSLQHPRGYYRTNITVGRPRLPGGWDTKDGATLPGSHCLDYYAILYKDGYEFFMSCLQIWPTWMYDLRWYDQLFKILSIHRARNLEKRFMLWSLNKTQCFI